MKLHHLGESITELKQQPTESKRPKVKFTYPKVNLNSNQMPEVSDVKPGQKVVLTFEGEVKNAGLGKDHWSDDKKGTHAEFTLMFGACRPARGKPEGKGKIRDFQDAAYAGAQELRKQQS